MTIQELFVAANRALLQSVSQIKPHQWDIPLPEESSTRPTNLRDAVRYHTYDDAWVPDVLAGKTAEEVGDGYEPLLKNEDVLAEFTKYNELASQTVGGFDDLDRVVHLSYGDFSAKEYLQHITSFRALRAYDIAALVGADTKMADDYVDALQHEYEPEIEFYRQVGVFPAAVEVPADADKQTKLLAMFGRTA